MSLLFMLHYSSVPILSHLLFEQLLIGNNEEVLSDHRPQILIKLCSVLMVDVRVKNQKDETIYSPS